MSKRKKPKIEEGQIWLLPFDNKKVTIDKVNAENDEIHYTFIIGTKTDSSGGITHAGFYNWIKKYHPKLAASPTKIWKELNE